MPNICKNALFNHGLIALFALPNQMKRYRTMSGTGAGTLSAVIALNPNPNPKP